MNILDEERKGATIELLSESHKHIISRSNFVDCSVIGRVGHSGVVISSTNFENCELHWKVPLKNMVWLGVRFHGCSFKGKFVGNRFGNREDKRGDCGSIASCDFSQAHLDGTDFHGCDMSTIKLPSWPCFTLVSPLENEEAILRVAENCPMDLKSTLSVSVKGLPSMRAVTWSAEATAARSGLSLDELFEHVKTLPNVLY